jgi:hypothetical protein
MSLELLSTPSHFIPPPFKGKEEIYKRGWVAQCWAKRRQTAAPSDLPVAEEGAKMDKHENGIPEQLNG